MDRKTKIVIFLAATLFLVVAIPSAFYMFQFSIPSYISGRVADSFLRCLVKDDLKGAFQSVDYFDKYSDVSPTILYNDAEEVWIKRVRNLKQNGTYIKSYKNIRTGVDDGYPVGNVIITAVEKGREDTYQASILFARLQGKWKIQAIYSAPQNLTNIGSLDYVTSGDVRKSR